MIRIYDKASLENFKNSVAAENVIEIKFWAGFVVKKAVCWSILVDNKVLAIIRVFINVRKMIKAYQEVE